MNVEIFSVREDGLPDMSDEQIGRVAFVWNGNLISGEPISDAAYEHVPTLEQLYPRESTWWEPSSARFGSPVTGVLYWVLLPVPVWSIQRLKNGG